MTRVLPTSSDCPTPGRRGLLKEFPLSCRLTLGALAFLAAAVSTVSPPAGAEPAPAPTPTSPASGRFRQLDVSTLGKIGYLPQGLRPDKMVSALVQLTIDPVAVQQVKQTGGFDKAAALRQVGRSQDAALPKLKAAGAHAYGRLSTVLNAVQVRVKVGDLARVAAVPGVESVEVSRLVRADNGAAERFTGVDRTWASRKLTGKGQTIGIIDTGIDYTHADFGGPGTAKAYAANDGTVVEPGSFPTAKVVGGYDFVGDNYSPSSSDPNATPRPDNDPLDCEGHGSHVAGTAAGFGVTRAGRTYRGPYNSSTLSFRVQPGVAPLAKLRAYRVFGCDGSAAEDIIVAAIDRAVAEGVNVINLSLGSPFGTANDLETKAIKAATRAGVLVVVSAGNSGSGAYLVGTPATANDALAVAAVDAGAARLPAVKVRGGLTGNAVIANAVTIVRAISGQLVDVGLGCAAADYAGVKGRIAVATRGDCARSERAVLGQAAGARAVILVNNEATLPPLEGPLAGVTIPFLGVSGSGSEASKYRAADGRQVTLSARSPIVNPSYRRVADFSSNGPRRIDDAQKPDIAAPGVSIPSVAVGTGTGSAVLSGTSMAGPHVAGVAALVRQAHPTWSSRQAKAAIMSTAASSRVAGFDSRQVGTGLVQPLVATATQAYAWTGDGLNSLRFGERQLNGKLTETRTFRISNRSSRAVTYRLSTRFSGSRLGATVRATSRSVKVKAHGTRTVSVRLRLSRAAVTRLPGASADTNGRLSTLRGLVVARPTHGRAGIAALSMAFLAVPVPLSDVVASTTVRPTASTGTIQVRNSGVHAGTAELYDWLLSDPAGDAGDADVADLTDLGVQTLPGAAAGADPSDRLMVFAAAQATGTSTQSSREVDLYFDTNRDGRDDYVTFVADTGLVTAAGTPDGTLTAFTERLSDGHLVEAWTAVGPANGSTVEMPVLASKLGLSAASGPVAIHAIGFSVVSDGQPDEMSGTARFDPYAPAVSSGAPVVLNPGRSAGIKVAVERAQVGKQASRGWLVVTLDDRAGRAEADRVKLLLPTAGISAAGANASLAGK